MNPNDLYDERWSSWSLIHPPFNHQNISAVNSAPSTNSKLSCRYFTYSALFSMSLDWFTTNFYDLLLFQGTKRCTQHIKTYKDVSLPWKWVQFSPKRSLNMGLFFPTFLGVCMTYSLRKNHWNEFLFLPQWSLKVGIAVLKVKQHTTIKHPIWVHVL